MQVAYLYALYNYYALLLCSGAPLFKMSNLIFLVAFRVNLEGN